MRKLGPNSVRAWLLVGVGFGTLGTAFAGQPTAYQGAITYREPVRICRLYPDGTRGPWIAYAHPEGVASCPVRGFDGFEPVLPDSNPCGAPLGIPTNGAAKGGVDPFCTIGPETMTCPIQGFRWLFGGFGTYATGSSTHPLNPPGYAVGQDVCELDFLFTENVAAGSVDANGQVVGNTFIDVVWHSTFNAVPPDCGTQPLVGDIVDGVGLDFGASVGGPSFFYTNVVLSTILTPPLPVMPAPGGAYSFYYWNQFPPGGAGTGGVVSGNNQPGGWGFKDAALQGSSGSIGYQDDDFSLATDDNGSQIDTSTECFDFSAGTLCPQPVIVASLRMGVASVGAALVSISSANPPTAAGNPYQPGTSFLDPLQNRNSTNTVSQGIGASGTPGEGPVQYASITVTFSGAPSPAPDTSNVAVACTGGTCPTVTSVTPVNATTFTLGLSGVIPALQCTTLTFAGTTAGEKLQYRAQPGNSNLDGFTNTQDLLFLVTGVSSGAANMAGNLARYDIDRSGAVNTQDFLREVQLLNGVNTTQVFNGTVSAACP
jgi:hypothetical protein